MVQPTIGRVLSDIERELESDLHRVLDPVAAMSTIPPWRQPMRRGALRTVLGGAGAALSLKLLSGVAVGVTEDLAAQVSAVELVKAAVEALGGQGGGGRPDMAQGGGPDGSKADEALQAVRDALEKVAA